MIVELENIGLTHGRYVNADGEVWGVARLIELTKNFEPFEIPLVAIHIGEKVFSESRSARAIAEHVKRVNETDLQHPIILDPDGFIMDGWHRVTKALVEGRETIKAVRFKELPYRDSVERDN
jgi:hypothetical protein